MGSVDGILNDLGIDPENVSWDSFAACKGWDIGFFFEYYEESEDIRPYVDSHCNSCPVQKECANFAFNNKNEGVWGGIYWTPSGEPDMNKNAHKTKEEWQQLESKLKLDLKNYYE